MPAIEGFVLKEVIQTFSTFLNFYYLVRRNVLDEGDFIKIQEALNAFHKAHSVFQRLDIQEGFSLPWQHSMKYYISHIQNFGAPNRLCSSITESAHIRFVKQPWHRSSRNNHMKQMLLINERLDKLATAHANFVDRGMLPDRQIRADCGPIIEVTDKTENGPVDCQTMNRVTALAQTTRKHESWLWKHFGLSMSQKKSTLVFTHLVLSFIKRTSVSLSKSICIITSIHSP
jgi:hypothetical protein